MEEFVNKIELLQLLEKKVKKYTSNESTSISKEKAKRILESIVYCIDAERMQGTLVLKNKYCNVEAMYESGLQKRKQQIKDAATLYEKIKETFYSYQNIAYYDTMIKGIPCFFERYDVEFDAKNHWLTLDYPLLKEPMKEEGIDLIGLYLKRIRMEQLFLEKWEPEQVVELLEAYDYQYQELFFNIAKVVLFHAIGCELVHQPRSKLYFDEEAQKVLIHISEQCNKLELIKKVNNAIRQIAKNLQLDKEVEEYLLFEAEEFCTEYKECVKRETLSLVFPIKKTKKIEKKEIEFIEGNSMSDDKLRSFIEELQEMRFTSDKVAMIRREIKSITDLKEVLEYCFGEELLKIFNLLGEEEQNLLLKEVNQKIEDKIPLKEWEVRFIQEKNKKNN